MLTSAVLEIINSINVSEEAIHVGIAVFSSTIGDSIGIVPFKSKGVLTVLAKFLRQPKGGTDTALGIEHATEVLVEQGRKGASKLLVIFTDGRSTNPRKTIERAKQAIQSEIHILAIGMYM